MKKNCVYSLMSLLALGILALSACAPATPTPAPVPTATEAPTEAVTEPPAAPTEELPIPAVIQMPVQIAGGRQVEIVVAGAPPDSQPELRAAWEEQAARFMALYPNVKIIPSDYRYDPDSFAALVAANQVPTLFQVYMTDPSKMVSQGVAADLTPYFQVNGLDKLFNPQVMSIVTVDGKIYGIPMKAYAMGLAYNKKMLEAAGFDHPPRNWDELATMAQALTNRDAGIAGFTFIFGDPKAAGWHTTIIAYDFGLKNTEIAYKEGDKYKAGFNNEAMLNALKMIYDLRWKYDVLPLEANDWAKNGEALATGHAAMALMASDQFIWIRQTFADVDMSQFAFAPLPAGPSGKSVSLVGGDVAMISASATPDQVEAAFYFRIWTQLDPREILARYEAGKKDPTTVVGGPSVPLYTDPYQSQVAALEAQYSNLPVEYHLFQQSVVSGQTQFMLEPLIAGQDYYGILGPVVSTIVTDKNADVAKLLADAQNTFQTNVLDLLQ